MEMLLARILNSCVFYELNARNANLTDVFILTIQQSESKLGQKTIHVRVETVSLCRKPRAKLWCMTLV